MAGYNSCDPQNSIDWNLFCGDDEEELDRSSSPTLTICEDLGNASSREEERWRLGLAEETEFTSEAFFSIKQEIEGRSLSLAERTAFTSEAFLGIKEERLDEVDAGNPEIPAGNMDLHPPDDVHHEISIKQERLDEVDAGLPALPDGNLFLHPSHFDHENIFETFKSDLLGLDEGMEYESNPRLDTEFVRQEDSLAIKDERMDHFEDYPAPHMDSKSTWDSCRNFDLGLMNHLPSFVEESEDEDAQAHNSGFYRPDNLPSYEEEPEEAAAGYSAAQFENLCFECLLPSKEEAMMVAPSSVVNYRILPQSGGFRIYLDPILTQIIEDPETNNPFMSNPSNVECYLFDQGLDGPRIEEVPEPQMEVEIPSVMTGSMSRPSSSSSHAQRKTLRKPKKSAIRHVTDDVKPEVADPTAPRMQDVKGLPFITVNGLKICFNHFEVLQDTLYKALGLMAEEDIPKEDVFRKFILMASSKSKIQRVRKDD